MSVQTGIYRILLSREMINKEQYDFLINSGNDYPIRAVEKLGFSKEEVIDHIVFATKIQYINPEEIHTDMDTINSIPERIVRKHKFIPLYSSPISITIVIADPTDISISNELEFLTNKKVKIMFSDKEQIEAMIEDLYNPINTMAKIKDEAFDGINVDEIAFSQVQQAEDISQVDSLFAGDVNVVNMINTIIADAINRGASDVHFEPTENNLHIRYRIDGDLVNILDLPRRVHPPIVSRIKILAGLDISLSRVPQDGKMRIRRKQYTLELRVSTLPTAFGEKAVLRILNPEMTRKALAELGFPPSVEKSFKNIISMPQGMVIVTGPTGSGKTTTLHAALNWVKSPKKNIVTVEDPIEYQQEGLNQVQINVKAGLDFAATLRSILRQDPDIVLVGEIRDLETVQIAIRAALTGHLLLSTIHTNNAASAVTRIEDIGVPTYLIASSLSAVLAQRLMKTLCNNCKREVFPDELNDDEKAFLAREGIETTYIGVGCDECGSTGYKGRTGIYEFLEVDADVSEVISRGATELELMKFCVEQKGMKTLYMDAVDKLRNGQTSVAEVQRIVGLENPLDAGASGINGNELEHQPAHTKYRNEITRFLQKDNDFKGKSFTAAYARPRDENISVHLQNDKPEFDKNLVLIVDDDKLMRMMVKKILDGQGFKVIQAENGEDGYEKLKKYNPGLLVLDVRMPILNGFEFLKRLRSDSIYNPVPVIMLTAEVEESRELFALDVGADDYVRKPFNPTIFLARVNAVIRRSKNK